MATLTDAPEFTTNVFDIWRMHAARRATNDVPVRAPAQISCELARINRE